MHDREKSENESIRDLLCDEIAAIEDIGHRETAMAMHLLIAAAVGTNLHVLSKTTGIEIDRIRQMAPRLYEAAIWSDDHIDDREWATADDRQSMWVLYLQAQVARGILRRIVDTECAYYFDADGEEIARVSLP